MIFQDRALWMPLRQRAVAVGAAEVEEAAELPAAPRWAAVVAGAAALRVLPWVVVWAVQTRRACRALAVARRPKSLCAGRVRHPSAKLRSKRSSHTLNSWPIGRATFTS